MTWASQYIGDEWVACEHDCWAFARRVWREQFGLIIPAVDVDALNLRAVAKTFADHPERGHWRLIDAPVDGAAVLMGKSKRPAHVGVWTDSDGGGVVHCVEKSGVIFSTFQSLKLSGWNVLGIYIREGV